VDGEARSIDSYQRSSVEAKEEETHSKKSESKSSNSNSTKDPISQENADGKVVTVTVDSSGGTLDGLAKYKNHQVHIEGAAAGETVRVRLEKGQGYLIGRKIKVKE
jgi:predicted RNA-binding protein with TRAM domain